MKPVNLPGDNWQRAFVKDNFADEDKEFSRSLQNNSFIDSFTSNIFYNLFFVLTSVWILMFYSSSANKEVFRIYCCLLLFFVINAFVTSVFSTVTARFQYRIFWVLPATNAILILKYLQKKYEDKIQLIIKENAD
jgi:hypothetical protein